MHKTHNVVAPPAGVPANSSGVWTVDENGTYTVTTLGLHPLPDVLAGLRTSDPILVPRNEADGWTQVVYNGTNVTSDHFELKADLSNLTGAAGFVIRASSGLEEYVPCTSWVPAN